MERTLILHIGPPKTGTTTLRKLVFPQLSRISYFDRNQTPISARIVSAFGGSPCIWRDRGDEIFNQLRSEMAGDNFDSSALISDASMSTHRLFAPWSADNHWRDPFLLAAHLRECRAVAQRFGFDVIKVLMGIRRQDQYLGSRYATHGWLADMPGQIDFERQTLEIINPEQRYFLDGVWLDYKTLYDLIADVVGEENVLLLPLEQLGDEPERCLAALSTFLDEQLNPELLDLGREKVRSVAPNVWLIKGKLIKEAARRRRLGGLRTLLARDTEIRLADELGRKILETYRDSNRQLASSLGLDLARYGYCDA